MPEEEKKPDKAVKKVKKPYVAKMGHNPWYGTVRVLAYIVFNTVMPVKVHHLENIRDEKAPYILIANHKHAFDPIAIVYKLRRYQVTFVGKKQLTETKIGKFFTERVGMIPVDREKPDLHLMRRTIKVVKDGGILGIFPEGTRYQEHMMDNVMSGTAIIALRSGVPLQPAYISRKLAFFKRTHVFYGKQMDISDLQAQGTDNVVIQELSERIRDTFMELREQAEKELAKKK